ncbi:hypothetical protein P0D75_06835 [Paraburkholderia sediminicola]|uniref:hypothetical protein n=1 Tax=Paraburkholderia sediminicola TaxID=458836 RepID=UPI0038B86C4B
MIDQANSMYLYFPPPANWQDFQTLAARVVCNLCDEPTVHEYGRQGQRQHGVDVHGQMFDGRQLGLQCKEMKPGKRLTKALIEYEAKDALSFRPSLDLFVITTTLPNDTKARDAVSQLNASKAYSFTIAYWSWDHYVDVLNRSSQLVASAYQTYAAGLGFEQQRAHLMALHEAFNRPCFVDDFANELSNTDFLEAISDMELFLKSGHLRDRLSNQFISTTYALKMLPKGVQLDLTKSLLTGVSEIRNYAVKDQKNHVFDSRKAPLYNALRQALIARLNAALSAEGLPTISIQY